MELRCKICNEVIAIIYPDEHIIYYPKKVKHHKKKVKHCGVYTEFEDVLENHSILPI